LEYEPRPWRAPFRTGLRKIVRRVSRSKLPDGTPFFVWAGAWAIGVLVAVLAMAREGGLRWLAIVAAIPLALVALCVVLFAAALTAITIQGSGWFWRRRTAREIERRLDACHPWGDPRRKSNRHKKWSRYRAPTTPRAPCPR